MPSAIPIYQGIIRGASQFLHILDAICHSYTSRDYQRSFAVFAHTSKPKSTFRQLRVAPKDLTKKEKCRVVYQINCEGGRRV